MGELNGSYMSVESVYRQVIECYVSCYVVPCGVVLVVGVGGMSESKWSMYVKQSSRSAQNEGKHLHFRFFFYFFEFSKRNKQNLVPIIVRDR